MPLPGLRLPASASLSLASCWPRPQQLLPVSATGGGRRRCSYRGEALAGRKVFLSARGSPTRGAVEELATRLRGCTKESLTVSTKKDPLSEIAAPGGGLSFWVSQWTHLLLPLSLLLYAILPKSQALCGKFTVTLLLASPVSFWRIICYNGFAALPAHLFGRGGEKNGKYSFFYTVCRSKCSSLLYLQVA